MGLTVVEFTESENRSNKENKTRTYNYVKMHKTENSLVPSLQKSDSIYMARMCRMAWHCNPALNKPQLWKVE